MRRFPYFKTLAATIGGFFCKKLLVAFHIDDIDESIYNFGAFISCLFFSLLLAFIFSRNWFFQKKWIYLLIILISISGIGSLYFYNTKLFLKYSYTYTTAIVGEDGIPKPGQQHRVLRSEDYKDTILQILKANPDIDPNRKDSILVRKWAGGFDNRFKLYNEGAIDTVKMIMLFVFMGFVSLISVTLLLLLLLLGNKQDQVRLRNQQSTS